jgi:hypothetical protein
MANAMHDARQESGSYRRIELIRSDLLDSDSFFENRIESEGEHHLAAFTKGMIWLPMQKMRYRRQIFGGLISILRFRHSS